MVSGRDRPGAQALPAGAAGRNGEAVAPTAAGAGFDLMVLRSMRRIIRCVDMYSKQLEMHSHVTAPQLICLLAIVERVSISAGLLAKEVHLSPSTIVGILDRLEEKGFVARSRGIEDRRIVHVRATDRGVALANSAPSPLQQRLADGLKRLPVDEQARIAEALERVVELMEAQHIDSAPILETGPLVRP